MLWIVEHQRVQPHAGAAAGDLASSEVMHIIRELDSDDVTDAMAALEQAVAKANSRLGDLIADDPAVEGMGTTLDALVWDGEKFAFAHIGDSRVYRLRGGEFTQISKDHTFVQSLIDEGRISVLSLVGAGLMGLSEGQSIDWPTQDGRHRRLTVLRVGALAAEALISPG